MPTNTLKCARQTFFQEDKFITQMFMKMKRTNEEIHIIFNNNWNGKGSFNNYATCLWKVGKSNFVTVLR